MRTESKPALVKLIQRVFRARDESWDGVAGRHRLTLREVAKVVVSDGDYWPFVGEAALGAKAARRKRGGRRSARGDDQRRT